jgi:hypothetical protein
MKHCSFRHFPLEACPCNGLPYLPRRCCIFFRNRKRESGRNHASATSERTEGRVQTRLSKPHDLRNTLIRVFKLKCLTWSLLRRCEDGRTARLRKPMQILEEVIEWLVRIDPRTRERTKAPGSSKRIHFERDNRTRKKRVHVAATT